MEGEWSCYRSGQFNGRWHGRYRGCQFNINAGRMVMLQRVSLMMGACSCYIYIGGQFNGGRIVMLQKWSL